MTGPWIALSSALLFSVAVACGGTTAPDTAGGTAVVVLTPTSSSLSVGSTLPLQVQVKDAAGNIIANVPIFWSSEDTAIATVSASGVVTAKALGTVQISANAEGQFAIASITVVPVPVASVSVIPNQGTITVGTTLPLQAVTYDVTGNILANRAVVWATDAPLVATVDANGVVIGLGAGSATISAASEGQTGSAAITVQGAIPVATVTITPLGATIHRRSTADFTATLYDAQGNVLTGPTITWASSNTSVATVSATGASTARVSSTNTTGTATITATATASGKQASVTVTVIR